jgi:small ligand-binding sensory domain FIST
MHWASAVSERVDTRAAVSEAASALLSGSMRPPDVVFVFASEHHARAFPDVPGWVREELGDAALAGCSAAGVIGGARELEAREALTLFAGWLPSVRVRVAHVAEFMPNDRQEWIEHLDLDPESRCQFLIFADAVTCDIDVVLQSLDNAFPAATKLGGLAQVSQDGSDKPATLFVRDRVAPGGAVIVALQGACEIKTVVSHACRPVGEPFIVTRCQGNVIRELNAGRPADMLRKIYDNMNARDLSLFNTSMFLGVDLASLENKRSYGRGDFVIRTILGIEPEKGALAVDARVKPYQVVQFHIRDRESAASDLSECMREVARSEYARQVRGALMFTCSGRGERLFGVPDHDAQVFTRSVGSVALSGFFGKGEIGPAGGKTGVHEYTAIFALFCEPIAN